MRKKTGNFIDGIEKSAREAAELGAIVLCVHVDADDATDRAAFDNKIKPALTQIENLEKRGICKNLIAVVPVQMMEAWMVCDKALLKAEIGTTKSDVDLGLDHSAETYRDPKQTIIEAIRITQESETRRRRNKLEISQLYSIIGQKIKLEKLMELPSYKKFRQEVQDSFRKLGYI